jgi:hypothetical protein
MNKRILVIEEPNTSENSQLPALAAEIGYLQCTSGRRSTWPRFQTGTSREIGLTIAAVP